MPLMPHMMGVRLRKIGGHVYAGSKQGLLHYFASWWQLALAPNGRLNAFHYEGMRCVKIRFVFLAQAVRKKLGIASVLHWHAGANVGKACDSVVYVIDKYWQWPVTGVCDGY